MVCLLVHKIRYYIKTEIILHIHFAIKPDRFIADPQIIKCKDNTNVKNKYRGNI